MAKLDGKITSLSAEVTATLNAGGTGRSTISTIQTGGSAANWFGPQQPLPPLAPPGVGGRRWDYPFGLNLQYVPRSTESIGFAELRALADALPILRAVIETRKDQIASLPWMLRPIPDGDKPARQQAANKAQKGVIGDLKAFFRRPDRALPYDTWLRQALEEMLVTDATTIYPRPTLGGGVYTLDVIDGATIKPLIDETGRRPEPPDPAYQQIIKGIVAADFTSDELLYLPRNVRASRIYGFSPVEQIVMTINIALRRDVSTLEYYRSGTVPDSFGTLPKDWSEEQIRQFQDYFDTLMMGNTQARRGIKFMPSDFKFVEAKAPPLKDQYDEWLARLICYVFSVPPTPFVAQTNRATAETQRVQASQEGLVPMQQWVKHFMDHIIQDLLGQPEIEFAWSDGDTIDPMVQMQVLTGYVAAGVKSRDEVRDEIGEGPIPDGTGDQYTVAQQLSPARLPTPEEQQQQHANALELTAAKQPKPGEGDPQEGSKGEGSRGEGPAAKLAKDVTDDRGNIHDTRGRFAPKTGGTAVAAPAPSEDMRPRDGQGRFIYSGGNSRGIIGARARRNRLIQGVQNAAERAAMGAVLLGGSILAATVFAPEAGAGALAIGIARAVGIASIGEAATSAVLASLEFFGLPQSMRDTVHTAVTLGLGAYGVASAKGQLETYMQENYDYGARVAAHGGPLKQPKGPAMRPPKQRSKKMLKAGEVDDSEATLPQIYDAIKAVLYVVGQDAIDKLKAEAASKAKRGQGAILGQVNDTLDATLDDFLDHVDRIGEAAPAPDPGGAKTTPTTDMSAHPLAATPEADAYAAKAEKEAAAKLKKAETWRFTEGGARNSLGKRDVSDEARDADGKWTAGGTPAPHNLSWFQRKGATLNYGLWGRGQQINGYLRGTRTIVDGPMPEEQVRSTIERLDKLVNSQTLGEDSVLYRGVTNGFLAKHGSKLVPGAVLRDNAYMSTARKEGDAAIYTTDSPETEAALYFSGKIAGGAMFRINAPKGSYGYDLTSNEFLLPRGTSLKIKSYDPESRIVEADLA